MKNVVLQFFKFGIVGVSNTIISYAVYLAGIYVGMHYLLANTLGFLISVINAFYWNNKYVFKPAAGQKPRSALKAFLKTFMAYAGTGLVLSNILLALQISFLGVSEVIAPLVVLAITVPLNFILNKLWAFR